MICAWQELVGMLPHWLKGNLQERDRQTLQELRLRLGEAPELIGRDGNRHEQGCVSNEDLNHCINVVSRYSPWAAETMNQGFLTCPGGHRMGIAGETIVKNGQVIGFRSVQSLCIRVARDVPGISSKAVQLEGSMLILGPPGWGKTTLLRDLIRQLSEKGHQISVIDQRGELFPGKNFPKGCRTDVITGCPKAHGIETALRCMGPQIIAVDEITAEADCQALVQAGWCGVRLLATAHCSNRQELLRRPVYTPLIRQGLFDWLLILQKDKSWRAERMCL